MNESKQNLFQWFYQLTCTVLNCVIYLLRLLSCSFLPLIFQRSIHHKMFLFVPASAIARYFLFKFVVSLKFMLKLKVHQISFDHEIVPVRWIPKTEQIKSSVWLRILILTLQIKASVLFLNSSTSHAEFSLVHYDFR